MNIPLRRIISLQDPFLFQLALVSLPPFLGVRLMALMHRLGFYVDSYYDLKSLSDYMSENMPVCATVEGEGECGVARPAHGGIVVSSLQAIPTKSIMDALV